MVQQRGSAVWGKEWQETPAPERTPLGSPFGFAADGVTVPRK